MAKDGLDISEVCSLAEYLNEQDVLRLLENAKGGVSTMPLDLLAHLIPFLTGDSVYILFQKILDGEIDRRLLPTLMKSPYCGIPISLVEEAVEQGALPWETLWEIGPTAWEKHTKQA